MIYCYYTWLQAYSYRNVLPLLSDKYHAIAFDWLGELHTSLAVRLMQKVLTWQGEEPMHILMLPVAQMFWSIDSYA